MTDRLAPSIVSVHGTRVWGISALILDPFNLRHNYYNTAAVPFKDTDGGGVRTPRTLVALRTTRRRITVRCCCCRCPLSTRPSVVFRRVETNGRGGGVTAVFLAHRRRRNLWKSVKERGREEGGGGIKTK